MASYNTEETELLTDPGIRLTSDNSRREFLKTSFKVGLGISLGLGSSFWLVGCNKGVNGIKTIWDELANELQGAVLRPADANFVERASPWALRFPQKLPQGIAVCINDNDVKACILWARKNNIPFVARSGGHSYAAYSTTTGLMIDISNMTDVVYDPATGLLTLGGGTRNQHVFDVCSPLGRAITHGRCFRVGVAGLVLGGGIGFDMRTQGYTCDGLTETRIVLADGRILTCNETENSDLFWACRGGGGGNFGIHTSFTFQTFAVDTLSAFTIEWNDNISATFTAIQHMTETAPNTLGIKVGVTAQKNGSTTNLTLSILGQLHGTAAELNTLLAPIYAVQYPSSSVIEEQPYWTAQELISEEGDPEYVHERSRFVQNDLSADAIQTILTNLNSWPGTSVAATWKHFLLGGQIDARSSTDMAMVHRGYKMLSSIALEWSATDSPAVVAENEVWSSNFHNQMAQYTSAQSYQNFIDPDQANYLDAYYGSNLPQLKIVKNKYDPNNVFNYPQSIPLI